jgi:hypothetical protein
LEYHQDRFQDSSLIVFEDRIPIAIFPSNQVSNIIYSHQGLTFGGLIWIRDLSQITKKNIIDAFLSHLSRCRFQSVEIKLLPDFYITESFDEIVEIFLEKGFSLKENSTTYVIENNGLIRGREGRWKLRKKFRQPYLISEVEDFSGFWDNVINPLYRDQIGIEPTHTAKEIQLLKSKNKEFIKQFVIYKDPFEILSGITVFDFEKVVKFQYIASTPKGKSLRAMDILMEHLLQAEYKNRQYVDLGTVHDPITKIPEKGLVLWKESWFAEPKKLFLLNFNLSNQSVN